MNRKLRIELGNELVLALDANPSTGYSWEAAFDDGSLALLKQEYRSASDLIGGGGKTIFTFRPVKEGVSTIVLRYRRPWEPEPIRTVSFEVTVS